MPGDQLDILVDNPTVRDAVALVLERSNGGEEEIQWQDVRDSLSSGQWGRLIEEEVLVSGSSGFVVSNPDRIRRHLDDHVDDAGSTPDGVESESWEWYDKVAGLTALVLFAGYWNTGVRDVISSVDNVVFGALTNVLPFYVVVFVLALVTGLYSTLLQGTLMDTEKIAKYQARMKRLKEKRSAAKERGDDEALERLQEEQMDAAGDQLGMFKLQFRPTVWIMLLTIPVFLWLRWKVRGGHLGAGQTGLVVPLAGAVTWQQSLFGPMPTWIVWYFLCSLASRQIIQKTLDIRTSPSNGDGDGDADADTDADVGAGLSADSS